MPVTGSLVGQAKNAADVIMGVVGDSMTGGTPFTFLRGILSVTPVLAGTLILAAVLQSEGPMVAAALAARMSVTPAALGAESVDATLKGKLIVN
jgi:hypothetical protein